MLLYLANYSAFAFPLALQVVFLFLERLYFLVEGRQFGIVATISRGISLMTYSFTLDFQLPQTT